MCPYTLLFDESLRQSLPGKQKSLRQTKVHLNLGELQNPEVVPDISDMLFNRTDSMASICTVYSPRDLLNWQFGWKY